MSWCCSDYFCEKFALIDIFKKLHEIAFDEIITDLYMH